jgi:nitroreductase
MMSPVLDAIFQRRAVKVFDPVEIPPQTREQILEAARLAPSSFNIQPYRFYWIETPAPRREAARLCMNQSPAATASALVVAVADLGSWQSTTRSYLEWMRTAGFSPEKIYESEQKSKWATKNTSLACENLMIAAEALGLNTCPMEGFDGRRLSKFLGLSARHHEIVLVIAIGKKSSLHIDQPQWRRPLHATVQVL